MKYIKSDPHSALRQAELLSNVIETVVDVNTMTSASPGIRFKIHPFAFVISQDCDLDWDFAARNSNSKIDRLIPNILFCELRSAEELAQEIVDKEGSKNSNKSRQWARLKINKDERYHFFESVEQEQDLLGQGVGELVSDFKRYFTVPTRDVYARILNGETLRRCHLLSPYLEHLSSRFAYFQSRVALPEDHISEPGMVKRRTDN